MGNVELCVFTDAEALHQHLTQLNLAHPDILLQDDQETMSMLSSADDARYTAVEIVHESRPNGLEYHNVEIEGMKPGGFLDGWIELSASTPPPAPLFPAFVPPTALLSRGHPPPGITISRDRH